MSETQREEGYYWLLNDSGLWEVGFWEDDVNLWKLTDSQCNWVDEEFRQIGPKLEPPPLPKKEEELPKGIETADALMAIFGYERVDYVEHMRQDQGNGPLASKGHTVSYTFKNKEAE